MTKKEYALTYINGYPEMAKTNHSALAKLMYNESYATDRVFTSVESARYSIRYALGHAGDRNRKVITKQDTQTPLTYDYRPNKTTMEKINAKVLILDIETAPALVHVWRMWKQNVASNQVVHDWFCLTWSAKWLFDKKVMSDKLTKKEVLKHDDKRIMKNLWTIMDEADIIIAHNGQKFDIPSINTRFLIHGLNPPSPFQIIDTLLVVRKQFNFSHNKLDYITQVLGLKRKMETGGFELWTQCYAGDEKALAKMEKYNIHDILITEETYLAIRAWIKPHPNMNLFILDTKESHCPTCGGTDLVDTGKPYRTYANNFEAVRCRGCGAIGRRRLSSVSVNERRHIIYSTPK